MLYLKVLNIKDRSVITEAPFKTRDELDEWVKPHVEYDKWGKQGEYELNIEDITAKYNQEKEAEQLVQARKTLALEKLKTFDKSKVATLTQLKDFVEALVEVIK